MRWSKLKGLVESRFAPSVAGRVELHSTRYRGAHDDEGRGWITIDKRETWDMCTFKYLKALHKETERKRATSGSSRMDAFRLAERELDKKGILSQEKFYNSLKEYCDLSLGQALASNNVLIASLAMLDRRLGKRKLSALSLENISHPMQQRFYEFRCTAEGLNDAL